MNELIEVVEDVCEIAYKDLNKKCKQKRGEYLPFYMDDLTLSLLHGFAEITAEKTNKMLSKTDLNEEQRNTVLCATGLLFKYIGDHLS